MRKKLKIFSILFLGLFLFVQAQSTKPVLFKLKDIRDVSKVAATNGQALIYVSATKRWTPATVAGTGDMLVSVFDTDSNGFIDQNNGGTNIDTSASTGLALVTAGTWSVSATPTFTTAHVTNIILEGGAFDTTITAGTPSAAKTYTWPLTDGTAGYALTTNGSGVLSWSSAGAGDMLKATYDIAANNRIDTAAGGTNIDTSASSGLLRVVAGTWSAITGTANYATYWSDANTVAGEQYLAVSRGGTGITTSGLTGVPSISSGVWSVSATLADSLVADNITLTNITQITNRSHTSLTDIGSNTHSTIDTHLGSTSNPHSVTKTQVGLGSVENTALSTWAGTTNITTLGTITAGTWTGTAVSNAKGGTGQDSSAWTGLAGVTAGTWAATVTPSVTSVTASGALKGGTLVFEGGTYDTTFQAGTPSASKTYTLPLTDGSNGQALTTNGSAILSWTTVAGGGDMLAATYDADVDNDINPSAGGTGINTSASTGTPQVASGTWSVLGTAIADTAANTFTITRGTTDLVVSADSTINQNLAIAASPTFAGLTVGSSTGIAKVTSGVLGASTSTITDGTNTYTITNGTSSLAVSGGAALTINQSVSTTSAPSFTGATFSANSATLTHSGTTNLTLASTSGTVTVEGVVFNSTNITTGGWQGTVVAPTYGGVGANTVAMTGYPYMTLGVVAQDTTLTHTTSGATITGAGADSVSITHDGTNATISTTDGEIILDSAEAAAVAQLALSDDDTNYVTVSAQEMASDWTMTLPAADGSAGSLLVDSNGSGTLAFLGTIVADTATNTFTVTKGTTDLIVSTDVTLNQNLSSSSSPTFATAILEGGTYDITLSAGTPAAAWTATFPTTAGSNGQVLTTNGTGTLSWTSAGAGDMTKAVYDTDADNYIDANNGGFDIDTSALTGVPSVSSGTWSVAATVPVTLGGTGVATLTTAYGLLAAGTTATGTVQTLAAGLATQILVGGGTGALPAWGTDIPTAVTIGTAYVYRVAGTDVAATDGGTGLSSYAVGDLLYAPTTTTIGKLADVAAGSYLRSGGVDTAPLWSTLILPNAATAYRLPVATSTNTIGELAAVGATGEYLKGNTGAIPSWATLNQAAVAGLTTTDGPTFDHLHITKGTYYTETDDGNSSTADTIDWTLGPAHKSTLTGDCTYTFTAPPSPCSLILRCVGDGTVRTVTWPGTVKWAAATKPTHTGTLNAIDLIAFYFDGTNYWAGATLDVR